MPENLWDQLKTLPGGMITNVEVEGLSTPYPELFRLTLADGRVIEVHSTAMPHRLFVEVKPASQADLRQVWARNIYR